MINVADLGETFGMSGSSVFRGYEDEFNLVYPVNYEDFVDKSNNIDLVIFGGGGDIHPSLYAHNNAGSYCGSSPSLRDVKERESFKVCIKKGIPVFGICRGAQLACAMAKGFLIQDIQNHAGRGHNIVDKKTNEVYPITSAHHQMMYPYRVRDHEVIAATEKSISRSYSYDIRNAGGDLSITEEPEIVLFPSIKTLAVQGHPEFMNSDSRTVVYIRDLIKQRIL